MSALAVVPASPAVTPSPAADVAAMLAALAARNPGSGEQLRCFALATVSPCPINVLVLGEPGTNKTGLARQFFRALALDLFDIAFSTWTEEQSLLGPYDLVALAAGRLERSNGAPGRPYLPAAGAIFFDEFGRAAKGCQDLTLRVGSDRECPDGTPVAAHVMIAASNTRLGDGDDTAMPDRFALRVTAPRVEGEILRDVRRSVREARRTPRAPIAPLPAGTVEALRARAVLVEIPADVDAVLVEVDRLLRRAPIAGQAHPKVSPRRWCLADCLLQASAVLADRDVVTFDDVLQTLPFVLDDGDETSTAVKNAINASIPAYVAALADVRKACAAAVDLSRRIHIERAALSGSSSAANDAREETLNAVARAMREHGDEPHRVALALVKDALGECIDIAAEGLALARRRL